MNIPDYISVLKETEKYKKAEREVYKSISDPKDNLVNVFEFVAICLSGMGILMLIGAGFGTPFLVILFFLVVIWVMVWFAMWITDLAPLGVQLARFMTVKFSSKPLPVSTLEVIKKLKTQDEDRFHKLSTKIRKQHNEYVKVIQSIGDLKNYNLSNPEIDELSRTTVKKWQKTSSLIPQIDEDANKTQQLYNQIISFLSNVEVISKFKSSHNISFDYEVKDELEFTGDLISHFDAYREIESEIVEINI